jgi:hypothetical protein
LRSKSRARSGEAYAPKFRRWASPHSWARMTLLGVLARSLAITIAEPRMKAKGEAIMRP